MFGKCFFRHACREIFPKTASMTDFQERLRQAIDRSGKSQRAISLAAGLNAGAVNDMLTARGRSPSVDNVAALAQALGTSFSWLAEGSEPGNQGPGFSESEVAPWAPKPRNGQRPDLAFELRDLTRLLAPQARNPAAFRATAAAPLFGILRGDILIIDLNARPEAGDIVVATVADLNTGHATTVLRKLAMPYLVSPDPSDHGPMLMADGNRTVVMGPVTASLRSTAFRSEGD